MKADTVRTGGPDSASPAQARMQSSSLRQAIDAVLVSIYMLGVLGLLLVRRRVGASGLRSWVLSFFRPAIRSSLERIEPENGHCYVAPCSVFIISDSDGVSPIVLLEDGQPLPHGHSSHDDIRRLGGGRYSHWGRRIYFSASDNSDPATNGRRYVAVETRW
ncbi:MAG TPA: hypothetical protein VM689_05130 [Aliidongia sp.]|nr:hypothetical protein [Aliidongia sp.]